jgi:hypothetical protein
MRSYSRPEYESASLRRFFVLFPGGDEDAEEMEYKDLERVLGTVIQGSPSPSKISDEMFGSDSDGDRENCISM